MLIICYLSSVPVSLFSEHASYARYLLQGFCTCYLSMYLYLPLPLPLLVPNLIIAEALIGKRDLGCLETICRLHPLVAIPLYLQLTLLLSWAKYEAPV